MNIFRWLLWILKPMRVRVVEIDGRTRIIKGETK